MSEETKDSEQQDVGRIEITVTEGEFSYNTNMTVPDMLFWMGVVGDLAVEKVLKADDE